jgi:hypothetical protein
MGIFCIFDTKFLVPYTALKILTNSKLAMFWFGKKVESFFTKVQKYFPKKEITLTPSSKKTFNIHDGQYLSPKNCYSRNRINR